MRHHTTQPDDIHGEVSPGHEVRDVHLRPIVITGVALVVTLFVVVVLTAALQAWFAGVQKAQDAEVPPLAEVDQTPPEPRLQPSNNADLIAMNAEHDEVLGSYGWVNQQQGKVRIPIDRAMELLVQRGLPVRPGATALPMPIANYGQEDLDGSGGQPPTDATVQAK